MISNITSNITKWIGIQTGKVPKLPRNMMNQLQVKWPITWAKNSISQISQILSEVFIYLYLWCKWISNQLAFCFKVKTTSYKYGVSPLIHAKFSNTAKLVMRKMTWHKARHTVHYSQAQGRQHSHKQQMDSIEEIFHFSVCGNLHSWVLILVKVLLTTTTNIKFKTTLQNSLSLRKFSKPNNSLC